MSNSELEKKLNHLIERNYDAEKGFNHVLEHIEHKGFYTLMEKSIGERYRFGHEIKAIMKDLGFTPDKGTSVEGDMHRAWMHFREIFSTNNDAAMLDEAIRGESHAEEAYKDVLKDTSLQPGHADILRNHLESIRASEKSLEILKRNVSATA
ncbi:PA2169 family four-helix-bundle protein [Cryomorpha ignava]|uniref:PA2169 family four-helix-bundle protein n=1 Tax=Cryomorpha ignava TaxID=101383 RepID=A0A7K3WSQ1_9FLAO|nr:PA2169 family four-helix-bundle protein [Cryomorpha ignava]NEN24719.1 PA2169 family four-helix-bundle protein [Cryomorpha ignava]